MTDAVGCDEFAPLFNPFSSDGGWYDDTDWGVQKLTQEGLSEDEGDTHSVSAPLDDNQPQTSADVVIVDVDELKDLTAADNNDFISPTLISTTVLNNAGHGMGAPESEKSATYKDGLITQHFVRNAVAMMMAAAKGSRPSTPTTTKPAAAASFTGKGKRTSVKATTSSRSSGGGLSFAQRDRCPFYKRIPGTPFSVDAFQYTSALPTKHHILTHFHSDHYQGLQRHFDSGTIYCTPVTSSLLQLKLGIRPKYIKAIPYNTPTVIEGVTITFLDANHCPGAAMVLFEVSDGRAYLHVGDFRWHNRMKSYSALLPYVSTTSSRRLDALYLDTTYCNPRYTFPPQEACVAAVVQTVKQYAADPGILFMFGSYTIGKERVFMEVAKTLNEKVYVDKTKWKTLNCFEWPDDEKSRLTTDPAASRIHVVPMGYLTMSKLDSKRKLLHTPAESQEKRPALGVLPTNKSKPKGKTKFRGAMFQTFLTQSTATCSSSIDLTGPSASPAVVTTAREFHSIIAFRPTGWAHDTNSGSHSMVDDDGDESTFIDVATQVTSALNRRVGTDDAPLRTSAVVKAGEDFTESRRGKVVALNVLVDETENIFMPDIAYHTVRMKRQLRGSCPRAEREAAFSVGDKRPATATTVRPKGGVLLFSVPYSEHSSFSELRECVAALDPAQIIPTVNCRSSEDAANMRKMLTSET